MVSMIFLYCLTNDLKSPHTDALDYTIDYEGSRIHNVSVQIMGWNSCHSNIHVFTVKQVELKAATMKNGW